MRSARSLMVVLISIVSLLAATSTRLASSAAAVTSASQDALHEVLPGDDLRLISPGRARARTPSVSGVKVNELRASRQRRCSSQSEG